MSSNQIWRSRGIFISSTFRDMHAERDYLHNMVFPELEERLKERYVHLEPVDFRWGVETAILKDQESKEMEVLKVCLAEIDRSRPFIIVLLGDRYGWVPTADRMARAASQAGYPYEIGERSVTALEIEYGIFSSKDPISHSFFYLRQGLPYETMDKDTTAIYSDQYQPQGQVYYHKM